MGKVAVAEKPATDKQKDLLVKLGYAGSTEDLTTKAAGAQIEALLAEQDAMIEAARQEAKRIDLFQLAGQHTQLTKNSGRDWEGACPRCGGGDRFHIFDSREGWRFRCYTCHEKPGDALEYLTWIDGSDFVAACRRLTQGMPLSVPTATQQAPAAPKQQPADLRRRMAQIVAAAQERLLEPAGEPGAEYLLSRGLELRTWLAYGVGFRPDAAVPGTEGKQRAPAIVLPWYAGGRLVAVRYRFLAAQDGRKITSEYGSDFTGRLFGGQALPEWAAWPEDDGAHLHRRCTLLIVEGEINAMSAWQAAADTRLHVLSTGSESAQIAPAVVQFAKRYGQVLVWADKEAIAQELMSKLSLPQDNAIKSIVSAAAPKGADANDLHRQGLLGGFLAKRRAALTKSPAELEALLWALYDAAMLPAGVDKSTAAMIAHLAQQLGKPAPVYEAEPGRWITAAQPVPVSAEPPADRPKRPPLPAELWREDLPTFAEARALQRAYAPEYGTRLGLDRERGLYFVVAPGTSAANEASHDEQA